MDIKTVFEKVYDGQITKEEALNYFKTLMQNGKKIVIDNALFDLPEFSKLINKKDNLRKLVIDDLSKELSLLLKFERNEIDITMDFSKYGLDSISINELVNHIREKYTIHFSPTMLFEYRNLEEFSGYLVNQHSLTIKEFYNKKTDCLPASNKKIISNKKASLETNDFEQMWEKIEKHIDENTIIRPTIVPSQIIKGSNSLVIINNRIETEFLLCGKGEPILLIGGIGCSARIWEKQLAELAKEYQVIVYYPPGHGKTSFQNINSLIKLVDSLHESLLTINIEKKIHLVGWSLGGLIAQQFAISYPDFTQTLTIASSSATYQTNHNKFSQAMNEFYKAKEQIKTFDESYIPFLTEEIIHYYNSIGSDMDFSSQLSKIKAPTLIITGKKDHYISYKYSELMQTAIRKSYLKKIPGAGHYLLLTHAKQFNNHLKNFISQQSILIKRTKTKSLRDYTRKTTESVYKIN